MAEAIPAPAAPPPQEGPKVYVASPGMVISTVKVVRTQDAFVAVEHPEGWDADMVMAGLQKRAMDLAEKTRWWDATSETEIDSVALGENEPDDKHCEPFALGEPEESGQEEEPAAESTADEGGE
jgi:hypothetical protein